MQELVKRLRRFAEERDWEQFHSPKNLSMALSVEVAELVEHFQWLSEEETRSLEDDKRAALAEEIGDVMIYLVNLSDKLGIDPLRAANEKLDENEKKYPARLVKGKSLKYTEY